MSRGQKPKAEPNDNAAEQARSEETISDGLCSIAAQAGLLQMLEHDLYDARRHNRVSEHLQDAERLGEDLAYLENGAEDLEDWSLPDDEVPRELRGSRVFLARTAVRDR